MNIDIPDRVLEGANISSAELMIEIAVHLYEKEILTLSQARVIAGLPLIDFQQQLAIRKIPLHYNINSLEQDMKNLGMKL